LNLIESVAARSVGFFCDSSDFFSGPTKTWIKHIDLAISLNRQCSHEWSHPGWEKFLDWPSVPVHEKFFEPPKTKAVGLHYIGSASRNRGDWLKGGIPFGGADDDGNARAREVQGARFRGLFEIPD